MACLHSLCNATNLNRPDRYIILDVVKSRSRMNTWKAIIPDDIPNWLLRSCAEGLAPADLYQYALICPG